MNPTRPDPGCDVCSSAISRFGRVDESLGTSRVRQSEYFRCVACDTFWEAYGPTMLPMDPEDLPADLEPAWRDADGNLLDVRPEGPHQRPPHRQLPSSITIGPPAREWRDGRLVVPFASRLGPHVDSYVASCTVLALVADALMRDRRDMPERSWTFDRVEFLDSAGRLHVGYGLDLDVPLEWDLLSTTVEFPTFKPGVYSATPSSRWPPDSRTPTAIGPGASLMGRGVRGFNTINSVFAE